MGHGAQKIRPTQQQQPLLKKCFIDFQKGDVIITKKGKVVTIVLNRPKALNALNLNMTEALIPQYKALHESKEPVVVVMKGAGGKAFCAGGDIRAIYDEVVLKSGGNLKETFFRKEYQLNHLIASVPQPHVALLNGITIAPRCGREISASLELYKHLNILVVGGGVGLSVHGHFRVATDNTVFAMPETGGTFFLPRLRGSLGMYLGLTGARLEGENVFAAGIATHFVPSNKLNELEYELSALRTVDLRSVTDLLRSFHVVQKKSKLGITAIDRCFSKPTLEEIFSALHNENTEWAKGILDTLSRLSPTSLLIVFHTLRLGKGYPLDVCLQMEYNVSQWLVSQSSSDFFEGVRAALVDKDKEPHWNPPTLLESEKDLEDILDKEMYSDKKYGSVFRV